jgi:hypothetical protein
LPEGAGRKPGKFYREGWINQLRNPEKFSLSLLNLNLQDASLWS